MMRKGWGGSDPDRRGAGCAGSEWIAPSGGFEPPPPAPEAGALSPELRGRGSQPSGRDDATAYDARVPGETILVVDDDPVIQQLVRVTFEMEGYGVITADDGVAGLERARTDRPALMILDVMMPRMNGIEVARTLKADPGTSAIPILMLSAKAQAVDVSAGGAAGVDDYVTKPFDPQVLLERAEALMQRPG